MFFTKAMVVLSLLAAVNYGWQKDWNHVGYWLCAAGITWFVLRMQ